MRRFKFIIFTAVLLLIVPSVFAQEDELCPIDIALLMIAAQDNCTDLEGNTACVGSPDVQATFIDPSEAVPFESEGDQASLEIIESIHTLPFDEDTGNLGIVVTTIVLADNTTVTLTQIGDVEISDFDAETGSLTVTTVPEESSCSESIDSVLVLQADTGDIPVTIIVNGIEVSLDGIVVVRTLEDDLHVSILEGIAIFASDNEGSEIFDPAGDSIPFGEELSTSEIEEDSFESTLLGTLSSAAVAGSDIVPDDGVFTQTIIVVCPDITNDFGDDVFYSFETDGDTFTVLPEGVDPLVYTVTDVPGVYVLDGEDVLGRTFTSQLTIVSNDQFLAHDEYSDGCVLDGEFNRVAE
ncbi:MAG: hypothetical protein L0154_24300 [Chloroflexi bacterium]|nr:hypothetical protein [Chloroflexota bacterium]